MVAECGLCARSTIMYFEQTIKMRNLWRWSMVKEPFEVPVWISLDSSSGAPIYRQLYERVRSEILAGSRPARGCLRRGRSPPSWVYPARPW